MVRCEGLFRLSLSITHPFRWPDLALAPNIKVGQTVDLKLGLDDISSPFEGPGVDLVFGVYITRKMLHRPGAIESLSAVARAGASTRRKRVRDGKNVGRDAGRDQQNTRATDIEDLSTGRGRKGARDGGGGRGALSAEEESYR